MSHKLLNKKYIVVFDMDETLGHFEQLNIFWQGLQNYYNNKLIDIDLYKLIDVFYQFLRPNIFDILNYLKTKKRQRVCDKILIYSNNLNKEWLKQIKCYFDYKLEYNLFDQVIAGFKLNNEIIEPCRTSYNKSTKDLITCAKLSRDVNICFIDDVFHPQMNMDNVVYIQIKPYVYSIPFNKMILKYYSKNTNKIQNKKDFIDKMTLYVDSYDYEIRIKSSVETKIDEILSKKIIHYLEEFFKD